MWVAIHLSLHTCCSQGTFLSTHSDDIVLMLLDLLRQLIGSTPVGGVSAGKLNLHKETHCRTATNDNFHG